MINISSLNIDHVGIAVVGVPFTFKIKSGITIPANSYTASILVCTPDFSEEEVEEYIKTNSYSYKVSRQEDNTTVILPQEADTNQKIFVVLKGDNSTFYGVKAYEGPVIKRYLITSLVSGTDYTATADDEINGIIQIEQLKDSDGNLVDCQSSGNTVYWYKSSSPGLPGFTADDLNEIASRPTFLKNKYLTTDDEPFFRIKEEDAESYISAVIYNSYSGNVSVASFPVIKDATHSITYEEITGAIAELESHPATDLNGNYFLQAGEDKVGAEYLTRSGTEIVDRGLKKGIITSFRWCAIRKHWYDVYGSLITAEYNRGYWLTIPKATSTIIVAPSEYIGCYIGLEITVKQNGVTRTFADICPYMIDKVKNSVHYRMGPCRVASNDSDTPFDYITDNEEQVVYEIPVGREFTIDVEDENWNPIVAQITMEKTDGDTGIVSSTRSYTPVEGDVGRTIRITITDPFGEETYRYVRVSYGNTFTLTDVDLNTYSPVVGDTVSIDKIYYIKSNLEESYVLPKDYKQLTILWTIGWKRIYGETSYTITPSDVGQEINIEIRGAGDYTGTVNARAVISETSTSVDTLQWVTIVPNEYGKIIAWLKKHKQNGNAHSYDIVGGTTVTLKFCATRTRESGQEITNYWETGYDGVQEKNWHGNLTFKWFIVDAYWVRTCSLKSDMYKHRQYLKYTEYNKIPNLIGEVYDRQVYNPLEDYSGYYLGAEISGKHHDRFEDIQDHVNFGGFVYDIYTKEPITYEKEYYTLYWRIQPARPKNANGGNNGGNAWNSTLIDSDNPAVVEIPAERQIGVGLYNGEDGTAETAQIVVTDLSNNAVISQSGTFTPPAIDVGKTYKIVAQLTDGSTKETTAEVVESSEQNGTKYNVTIPSKGTVKNAVVITVIPSSAKENITGIKWYKGSTEIEGATGESYTPKEEDANSEIKAVVTFQESGSDPETVESNVCTIKKKDEEETEDTGEKAGHPIPPIKTAHIRGGNWITLEKDGECVHDGDNCYISKVDWDGVGFVPETLANSDSTQGSSLFHYIQFRSLKANVANDICTVYGSETYFDNDTSLHREYTSETTGDYPTTSSGSN